jgi:hypothetical protein
MLFGGSSSLPNGGNPVGWAPSAMNGSREFERRNAVHAAPRINAYFTAAAAAVAAAAATAAAAAATKAVFPTNELRSIPEHCHR